MYQQPIYNLGASLITHMILVPKDLVHLLWGLGRYVPSTTNNLNKCITQDHCFNCLRKSAFGSGSRPTQSNYSYHNTHNECHT
jgi:hypothetical protein